LGHIQIMLELAAHHTHTHTHTTHTHTHTHTHIVHPPLMWSGWWRSGTPGSCPAPARGCSRPRRSPCGGHVARLSYIRPCASIPFRVMCVFTFSCACIPFHVRVHMCVYTFSCACIPSHVRVHLLMCVYTFSCHVCVYLEDAGLCALRSPKPMPRARPGVCGGGGGLRATVEPREGICYHACMHTCMHTHTHTHAHTHRRAARRSRSPSP
jgi:hypothetical protein